MEKQIDTQELSPGKYVSGLVRPWLETPFLFQHFEINDQSDVTDLPWHCQFAYFDIKLSPAGRPGIDPTAYILQGYSHGS